MVDTPRRLLWIHQNFVSRGQAGNERPIYTVSALLERGWSVDLVTGTEGYQGGDSHDLIAGRFDEGRLSWHRIDLGPGQDFVRERARAYFAFMRQLAAYLPRLPRPDLVFASTPPLPQVSVALKQAMRHAVPLVLEVRDLWPSFLVEAGLIKSRIIARGLEWLEAACYQSADAVVAVSPAFRPYLEGMGVSPQRLAIVPHGAVERDIGSLIASGRQWRAERGLDGATVIVYAGSLHAHYGVETLIAAATLTAHDMPPIVWVVAGNGRAADLVKKASQELPNLRYEGALPRRVLDPLLGAADAALVALSGIPLFSSVLPGKLVDCLACGLPVVCTVAGQARRLVERTGAGWTCSDDPLQLANTARRVAQTPLLTRRDMGERGRRFVRERMPAELQGRAIADLCQRVCDADLHAPRRRIPVAFITAAGTVATRRSKKLLDTLYRQDGGANGCLAFDAWMDESLDVSVLTPLAVPELLS